MDGREAWEAVTRRGALRRLALAAAGLPLVELLGRWTPGAAPAPALAEEGTPTPGTGGARTVIEIWMSGGPCHLDTFDPKPEAGRDFCGPLDRAVPTAVDGMRLGALFPLLAAQASRFSLLRGLSHGNNGHETAAFISRTGRAPGERTVHPGIGSVVSLMRGYGAGYDSLIPPFVVLTTPLGRVSEQGFLGPRYAPFVTGGDPARPRFTASARSSTPIWPPAAAALLASIRTSGSAMNELVLTHARSRLVRGRLQDRALCRFFCAAAAHAHRARGSHRDLVLRREPQQAGADPADAGKMTVRGRNHMHTLVASVGLVLLIMVGGGCCAAHGNLKPAGEPPVITDPTQVAGAVGKLVTLRGEVLNSKIASLLGVDVESESPDLRGKPAQATGVLEKSVVTREELDRQIQEMGGEFQHRGPGTTYRLVEPGTGRLVQVQPPN